MTSGRRGMGAIGAGFMGPLHARLWSQLPNTRLVAIADPDERTAKSVADELGVACYRDSASLLERDDIDAVSVVTPDRLHAAAHPDRLGEPIHLRAKRNTVRSLAERIGADSSILYHLGVRGVDMMQWVARSPIIRVYARKVSKLSIENEDALYARAASCSPARR